MSQKDDFIERYWWHRDNIKCSGRPSCSLCQEHHKRYTSLIINPNDEIEFELLENWNPVILDCPKCYKQYIGGLGCLNCG